MYHILEENKLANCKELSIQISLYLKMVRDYSYWSHGRVIMTQKHRLRLLQIPLAKQGNDFLGPKQNIRTQNTFKIHYWVHKVGRL